MTASRFALLLFAACSDTSIVVGGLQEITTFPATPNRDLDLLFVIDNSPSMAPKQAALAAGFFAMMDVLAELPGGRPNLHIGVVTSDLGTSSSTGTPAPPIGAPGAGGCANVGDDGLLQFANAPTLDGTFLSDVDGVRNYTGELRDVFAQLASVGDGGCGFEQHLAAMRRALANPSNAGFVRDEANLAVVIIADEDDCSARAPALFGTDTATYGPLHSFRCTEYGLTCDQDVGTPGDKTGCVPRLDSPLVDDVQPFVDALVAAKGGDERKVLVATIVGDPSPVAVAAGASPAETTLAASCVVDGADVAMPAVRLAAFLDAFPGRSQHTSICASDLSSPLAAIGQRAKGLQTGNSCLDASLVDTSDRVPGIQPACEVFETSADAGLPTVLPSCASGAADCYDIVRDPAACPTTPDHLRVTLQRTTLTSTNTWAHVHCQVQPR